jgi:Flp pilus assembly protein TadB
MVSRMLHPKMSSRLFVIVVLANCLALAIVFWLVPWPWSFVGIAVVAAAFGTVMGKGFSRNREPADDRRAAPLWPPSKDPRDYEK